MSGSASTATVTYAVQDLVALALRQIGVGAQGTTPAAPDIADGVMHLNMMLAQWQRRRWLVPALVELIGQANGLTDMFVGPGKDFDTPNRPDQIEAAFARYLGGGLTPADFSSVDFNTDFLINNLDEQTLAIDYPLSIIQSREDYSAIGVKNLRTFPSAVFYSPEWPAGRLNIWPIPQKGLWEIHLVAKMALPANLQAASAIVLPPEYWDAIMWNLAARLAPSYGQAADESVVALARSSLQTIRTANLQVPSLGLPADLIGRRGGGVPYYFVAAGLV
jgi:hypothetical protein